MHQRLKSATILSMGLALIFFSLAGTRKAAASDTDSPIAASKYYEGKTIHLIVPFSAGGSYDRMARLIARYAPAHIPGEPTVIVENRPGGGGLIGARFVYDAKPDGLTLLHIPSDLSLQQFTGFEKHVDLRKFDWIGSVGGACFMMYIRSQLPYHSVDDLRNAPEAIKIGGIGRGNLPDQLPLLLKEMIGLNLRVVAGYKGYDPIALAVRQGEIDGALGALVLTKVHPLTKEMLTTGFIRIALLMRGMEPTEEYRDIVKNVPDARDFIKDDRDRRAYQACVGILAATRLFAAPPGTDPKVLSLLRNALQKTMQDEEFTASATKAGFVLEFKNHSETASLINDFLDVSGPAKERLIKVLELTTK